jgi:molybdopterin synthase sulfur carrier subunit
MSVTVRIPTILRNYTNNESTVEVSAGTLVQIIDSLEASAPGIKARIVDDAGALRRFVNVFVGEEDVRFLDGIDTAIADGVTVSVIPAVAGG